MDNNIIDKRTKGEWIYSQYSTDYGIYSQEGNGNDIALVRDRIGDEGEANAALICKAVNNYDALVSALETAQYELKKWHQSFSEDEDLPGILATIDSTLRNAAI